MDQLLAAYQKWPPINQLILLVILLGLASVLLFVLGWWLRSLLSEALHALSVWFRGWPPGPDHAPTPAPPQRALPPPDR